MDAIFVDNTAGRSAGMAGEEIPAEATRADACVVRANLSRLAPTFGKDLQTAAVRAAHRQAQRDVATSEARFRSLIALSCDWYWEQDTQFRFTVMAGGLSAKGSLAAMQVLGKTPWQLPMDPGDGDWATHRATLEAHRVFIDFEYKVLADDGHASHYSARGEPIFDDKGRFSGYRGTANDITERKDAEAKIRRQAQLYAALNECNKAIVHSATEEELFSNICRAAVQIGGMKMAWIGLIAPQTRLIQVAASFGERAPEYLQGIEISVDPANPLSRGPTGMAIRENRPYWCQDVPNDPITVPWRERAAHAGWSAVGSLPLHGNGRVIGAFVLYAGEANTFDESARNLLIGMASDISFALTNFAREAERKRTEKELRAADERFRGLVEQAIAGIYIIQDDKLAYVNPRFAEIFGYASTEELIGRSPVLIVAEKDRGTVAANVRRRIEGEIASLSYDFAGQRKDGTLIDVGAHGARATHGGQPAVIGLLQDISEKKRAEEEIRSYIKKIETALLSTVEMATLMSEMRDPYTAGHQRQVAKIAVAIGAELGFDASRQEGLRIAGNLHDIGKFTIPSEILSKPGKLSRIEFQLVQGHSQAGYDVLKGVPFPWPVAAVALQHHERMDGSGYPRGLKGEAILLEARIMAVADVVEAMSSHRPYRPGLGLEAALAQLRQEAGTRLDADVVAACERLFREKGFRIAA